MFFFKFAELNFSKKRNLKFFAKFFPRKVFRSFVKYGWSFALRKPKKRCHRFQLSLHAVYPSVKPVQGLNSEHVASSNRKEHNCFPIFCKLYQQKLCRRYWCSTCTNCHFVWCQMSVGFCVEKKSFSSFTTLLIFIWKSQVWFHKKN